MNRQEWQQRSLDAASRAWLERDADAYLHQAGSTPCIASIKSGDGVWLEDHTRQALLDLYGNSVHHVGYRHPRLVAALTAQLNELTFAPRRFTNEPAILLAEKLLQHWPGGKGQVLLTTGGSGCDRAGDEDRPRRDRPLQDDLLLRLVSTQTASAPSASAAAMPTVRRAWGHCSKAHCMCHPSTGAMKRRATCRATCRAGPRNLWTRMRLVFTRERDIAAVIAEPIPLDGRICRRTGTGPKCASCATGMARCWCSTRSRPASARPAACSPASMSVRGPT